MKSLLVLAGIVAAVPVYAQQKPPKSSEQQKGSVTVAGTAWGTGVVTGIAGVKQLKNGANTKNLHFQDLMDSFKLSEVMNEQDIKKVTAPIKSGDEIVVKYRYDQFKNQEAWIKGTEKEIANAEAAARYYEEQAKNPKKTTFVQGKDLERKSKLVSAGKKTDYYSVDALTAEEWREDAMKLRKELKRVKTGTMAAPILEVRKRIVEKYEGEGVKDFLRTETARSSEVYYVSRLPKAARLQANGTKVKGGLLLGIAVFSTALGTWEYLSGDVSSYLNSKEFKFSSL